MMDDKTYQKIFDKVSNCLIPGWEALVVYLEYGVNSYTYSLYVRTNNEFINGYDMRGVSEDEIDKAFREIDKIVLKERKRENNELWTNMTLIVKASGNMHVDFDYTDLSQGTYQFKINWKKKYLK